MSSHSFSFDDEETDLLFASRLVFSSMEIGSAYALQVCLLQIPAMVAFSALYDPSKMGEVFDTFT